MKTLTTGYVRLSPGGRVESRYQRLPREEASHEYSAMFWDIQDIHMTIPHLLCEGQIHTHRLGSKAGKDYWDKRYQAWLPKQP